MNKEEAGLLAIGVLVLLASLQFGFLYGFQFKDAHPFSENSLFSQGKQAATRRFES
jgi:hypothetical protein